MTPLFKLSVCAALLGGSTLGLHAQNGTIVPGGLRCEDRENPLGVDMAQPRLSWVAAPSAPRWRELRQSAYEVMAASSPAVLASDQADLWDSGRVTSSLMNQVPYAGRTLVSDQLVFWKVRLWDQSGNPSAWSPVSRWTTGILQAADWREAKWIGAPDANAPIPKSGAKSAKTEYETVLLRRGFNVRPGLRRAIVQLCGLGQYEMTLNGAKVGDAMLTPGWTLYDKTCLYDTYDITAALRSGANAIGVFLGNGFYNVHAGRYTKITDSFGAVQTIGLIHLEYADGTSENIVTDDKWKAASGPIVFSSIYGGEDYDARLEPEGWDLPGFSDLSWVQPAITKGPGGTLKGISDAAPPIRVMEILPPIGKKQIAPGVVVYDLGQNAALMATLHVKGSAGATVKVTPAEIIHENGDIDEHMCNNDSYCTYTLRGKGDEIDAWKFYYRGGRYLRVETKPAPGTAELPEVTKVEARVIRADSPVAGQFSCSSELFNKVFTLIRWAQMNNMMSVMTDCPTREKLGWLEEDHLNGPALRYNFDLTALFAKMCGDMADSQYSDGLVPSCVPDFPKWGEGKYTVPIEWGSACIIVPWQQYEFTGDAGLLAEHYGMMMRYIDYITKRADNHIVGFGLGDWYDNHSEGEPTLTPVALTDTAFYYQDYILLARIAKILGKTGDVARFEQQAGEVLKAFNAKFLNPATNLYGSGSEGANCLPLAFGMVDPAKRPPVINHLVQDLEAKGTTVGEVSFRYLLRALADGGRSDVIYSTYSTDTQGYGLQVKLGKTSLTEAWNGGNASQDHFMFGQLNEWFYHDLAGIQDDPEGPGFAKIVIKPALVGDLTAVKASYRSVQGEIVSAWTHGPGGLTMNVTIPVGATALIHVPAANPGSVRESGLAAASAPGVRFVRVENGAAVYAVGSGTYAFSSADAPVAPSRLTATSQSGEVALSWSPSVNGTGYTVKRAIAPGGSYVPIARNLAATTYSDMNVVSGTTYYYAVCASNAFGEGLAAEASATPSMIANAGFEVPSISDYVNNPTGAAWTFTPLAANNGSGLTRNGSGYTGNNPGKIPEGDQAAYLQGTGTISQTLNGLTPGASYTLTFSAAQRASYNKDGQTWQVKLDGKVIGEYSPPQTATAFTDYGASFRAPAGSATLTFAGTNTRGGDNTVFIDNLRLLKTR
jgi:alpha-L-rhamnosidase